MTHSEDFFWLVGILEGEGSFMRPSPSSSHYPKIDLEMRDEDVIKRVSVLWGISYRKRDRHRLNTSITYHIRLTGSRAVRLMRAVYPYLSSRRKEQVLRACNEYQFHGKQIDVMSDYTKLPEWQFRSACKYPMCGNAPTVGSEYCTVHNEA